MTYIWPEERKSILREMWAEGYSAPAIAEKLGGITDSAVLKMKDRLGLTREGGKFAPHINTQWTDARVERLKSLWGTISCSKIGVDLGVSRNAVIGKAHRIGLSALMKSPIDRQVTPRKPRVRNALHRNTRILAKANGHDIGPSALPVIPLDDFAIPIEQRCTLMQLTKNTCRFPIGEPGVDLFFCGAKPMSGHPYCRGHSDRAFNIRDSRPRQFARVG